MSYLSFCLNVFGYIDLAQVTAESLKRVFKRRIVQAHPDKGGSEDDFETVVSAYMYLSEILQRVLGGRQSLQTMENPDELRKNRRYAETLRETNQILNEVFDECLQDAEKNAIFQKEFNERFEASHISEYAHGYETWLKDDSPLSQDETKDADFHAEFEKQVRHGKPPVTNDTLMVHPEDMAWSHHTMGVTLTGSTGYTSVGQTRPSYTDVYMAYTTDNTVLDKVMPFVPSDTVEAAFQRQCKERGQVIAYVESELDKDLAAIAAYERDVYEKVKADKEAEHQQKLAAYFQGTNQPLVLQDQSD